MLAAIRTTILSSRSCAETCSAMVSRSRLNKTRGPPDALRMCRNPPPVRPAGRVAGGWRKTHKNNNFIQSAPPQAPSRPNRDRQNCGTVCGSPPIRPYSQLRLVLPSKTPARGNNVSVSANAAPAKRMICKNASGMLSDDALSSRENALGLIEPVERVQRANRKFGIGGVDQHRELDLGGGDGPDIDIALGQALNAWAATPAWLRMPMPITETLATSVAPSSLR